MFQHTKSGLKILLTCLIVINLVELVQQTFERLHNFETQKIVNSLKATNSNTLVKNVQGLESKDFLFLVQVVETKSGLYEDSFFGIGEGNDLIEQKSEERVAILVLEPGHRYVLIIVQLLIPDLLEDVVGLFDVCITVY